MVLFSGCTTVKIPQITGIWTGNVINGSASSQDFNETVYESNDVKFIIHNQSGNNFSGVILSYVKDNGPSYEPSEVGLCFDISGSVSADNSLEFAIDYGPDSTDTSMVFAGVLSGNSLSGTVVMTEIREETIVSTGTWSVVRQSIEIN